jgi:hypothetical protein
LVGFCFDLRRGIGGFGLTEREQDAVTAFLRRLENENAPKLSDSDLVCIEQAYVRFRLMQRIIYNPGRYQ